MDSTEVERLAALWVIERLEEDDEARFADSEEALYESLRAQLAASGIPVPPRISDRKYVKQQETMAIVGEAVRDAFARGKAPPGFDWEMEEFLKARGVSVASGSPPHKALRVALLTADRKAFDMLERRHQGECIEAPPAPPEAAPEAAGPTLAECVEKWIAKRARPEKTTADAQASGIRARRREQGRCDDGHQPGWLSQHERTSCCCA